VGGASAPAVVAVTEEDSAFGDPNGMHFKRHVIFGSRRVCEWVSTL